MLPVQTVLAVNSKASSGSLKMPVNFPLHHKLDSHMAVCVYGLINPWRAYAARVTVLGVCVCVCVCVSVAQHLTFYMFIRATNDTNLFHSG